MPARLHKQTVDENCYDGEDHDSKDAGVITRPSEGGNQKWERRLTVFTPPTSTGVIAPFSRHGAFPLNLRGSFQRAFKQRLNLAVATDDSLQSIAATMSEAAAETRG
jgi:hypothetical protein